MNISILSLISSSIFSPSPFIVGNRLSFINGHLEKYTSLLFLNQENLLLKNSVFSNIYGSIVYNSYENDNQNIHRTFYKENYNNNNKFSLGEISEKQSISVIECVFDDVYEADTNILKVTSEYASLYITDSLFYNCKSSNGVIYLTKCRCLTITHTCSCKSHCQSKCCFLYYQSQNTDFSKILYNSIVHSELEGSGSTNDVYTIKLDSNDQYFRCNNMTESLFGGVHFNNDQCLSFVMSTISCNYNCMYFSGGSNENSNTIKELEMINLCNKGSGESACIRFGQNCRLQLIIKKAILISERTLLVQNNPNVKVSLYECIFDKNKLNTPELIATEENCQYKDNINTNVFISYPHFTYGTQCPGVNLEDKNAALGCNVGNCITNNCGRTIGFPDDVVAYTSVFHGDIQTPTLPPSKPFSRSSYFSSSEEFSKSNNFIPSNYFSDSIEFTKSSLLSPSNYFSDSNHFSELLDISPSNYFSDSKKFTKSSLLPSLNSINSESLTLESLTDDDNSFKLSLFVSIYEFFDHSNQPDSNLGKNGKSNKGKMIGIIVGVVAGVSIIAIVTTIVLLKKRTKIDSLSEGDVITQDVAVTVENTLQNEMAKDDPFADDFK